jgi:hypothetical protein
LSFVFCLLYLSFAFCLCLFLLSFVPCLFSFVFVLCLSSFALCLLPLSLALFFVFAFCLLWPELSFLDVSCLLSGVLSLVFFALVLVFAFCLACVLFHSSCLCLCGLVGSYSAGCKDGHGAYTSYSKTNGTGTLCPLSFVSVFGIDVFIVS